MEQLEMPTRCGIMEVMSAEPEIRARLMHAGRNYTRAKDQFDKARAELVAAIVDARKRGTLIEDIAADVPYLVVAKVEASVRPGIRRKHSDGREDKYIFVRHVEATEGIVIMGPSEHN